MKFIKACDKIEEDECLDFRASGFLIIMSVKVVEKVVKIGINI